jgi:hypothetical protein
MNDKIIEHEFFNVNSLEQTLNFLYSTKIEDITDYELRVVTIATRQSLEVLYSMLHNNKTIPNNSLNSKSA